MVDHQIDGSSLLTKRQAKKQFREGILNSWGSLCAYCGRPGDTLDHVRPRGRGGLLKEEILCAAAFIATRQKAAKVIGVNGSGNKNGGPPAERMPSRHG